MRRGGTGLVVLVVAAIAIAAGFDALRGEGSPQPSAETAPEPLPPTTSADEPVEEEPPLADQLDGTLYYTDGSCELQAVELPGPAAVDAPNWDECRFVLSPDGRRVSGAGSGWDPRSDPLIGRVFQARDGSIQVSTNGGPEGEPFAGTAPAWTRAGTLTYFAGGALRVWSSGNVILSQRELVRSVREAMPFEDTLQAVVPRETAWLDDGRLAAIFSTQVGGAPSSDLLAVYEDDRLTSFSAWEQEALSDLRVSPQGNYVAARTGAGGLVVLDSSGAEIETPALTGYRAIAWSPDDRWAAVATDTGVLVFQPGAPGPPELELDLDANDLDWRGGLDQAPVARQGAGDATDWLAAAGMGGRVFVTQTSDAGCRLRAVEIPSLAWAETPAGLESPCRFAVDDGGIVVQESDVPQIGGGELGTCGDLEDCAFAWAPGGRATYVAGGELFLGRPEGRSELLVSAADLERIFGRPSALEEVAWVDDDRFWAVVRTGDTATVALMTADALVASPWFGAPSASGLRVSSTGMAAVSSDRGVVFFDSGGRRALTFTNGRDVTWAPGEIVAAVSTPREVIFVAPLSGEVVTVPLEVRDLEWWAE